MSIDDYATHPAIGDDLLTLVRGDGEADAVAVDLVHPGDDSYARADQARTFVTDENFDTDAGSADSESIDHSKHCRLLEPRDDARGSEHFEIAAPERKRSVRIADIDGELGGRTHLDHRRPFRSVRPSGATCGPLCTLICYSHRLQSAKTCDKAREATPVTSRVMAACKCTATSSPRDGALDLGE